VFEVQKNLGFFFLSSVQAFAGTQNVSNLQKDEAWKVNVRLQGCDMQSGYLCGSMEALNVPSAETPVKFLSLVCSESLVVRGVSLETLLEG